MTQDPLVSALQGPSDPAISALFAHPAQHLQRMAGEVIPFPVDQRTADMRRIGHEDMLNYWRQKYSPEAIDQYRATWPSAPVLLGPGANK